jgi:predicted PurR-regulated permease PerM
MPDLKQNSTPFRMLAVGLVTFAVTAVFVGMIWNFLTALFLAAVFSAMATPLHRKVLSKVGDRQGIATAITLTILIVCVLVPALAVIYLAAIQANELADNVVGFVQRLNTDETPLRAPDWLPFKTELENAGSQIASKVGELAGKLAGYFVTAASAATKGTAKFFLSAFIMIYAMVFFLRDRTSVLAQLMRYSGLSLESQDKLVERVLSISRATMKGTLVIGLIQGVLGGIGFWVAGDNVLRPTMVGRDTEMPDLIILVSTLGGLAMFGAEGLIIGPVIAGLFITMWEIFSDTFGHLFAAGTPKDSRDD